MNRLICTLVLLPAVASGDPGKNSKRCSFENVAVDEKAFSEDGVYQSQVLARYIVDRLMKKEPMDSDQAKAKKIALRYFGDIAKDEKKILLQKVYAVILTQRSCIQTQDFNELVRLSNSDPN
jgi:hypothetical protein